MRLTEYAVAYESICTCPSPHLLHLCLLPLVLQLQLLHLELLCALDSGRRILPKPRAALGGVPVTPPRVLHGNDDMKSYVCSGSLCY